MIKIVTIDRSGKATINLFDSNKCPNLILKKIYSEDLKWDINYANMNSRLKNRWYGVEIYWRLRRALEHMKSVIIGNEIFQLNDDKGIEEIHALIQRIIQKIQEDSRLFWLNEEDPDCLTVIRR